jgi:hypothetical protein
MAGTAGLVAARVSSLTGGQTPGLPHLLRLCWRLVSPYTHRNDLIGIHGMSMCAAGLSGLSWHSTAAAAVTPASVVVPPAWRDDFTPTPPVPWHVSVEQSSTGACLQILHIANLYACQAVAAAAARVLWHMHNTNAHTRARARCTRSFRLGKTICARNTSVGAWKAVQAAAGAAAAGWSGEARICITRAPGRRRAAAASSAWGSSRSLDTAVAMR